MAEGIAAGLIPGLAGYRVLRREVAYGPAGLEPGRLDLGLWDGPRPDALVEVKNCTLLDSDCLRFPDAVSLRGRKHLDLLAAAAVAEGRRGVMLFALNRPEGSCFAPAWAIDPGYGRRLREVADAGVEVLAVRLRHGPRRIDVGEGVAVDLTMP
jgi:sugar fermentation stimulation protein A